MKAKIFVTRKIPQAGLDMLADRFELEVFPHDRTATKDEITQGIRGKDGLLCLLTDNISADMMDAAPGLKVIANYAVGFNNIDVAAATQRQIAVTNTPGVLTETTADLAFALLMSAARRIVESDKFTRAGKFEGWAPLLFLGQDIYQKTLGIVGFGRIGQAMARRASGFDMKVLYYSAHRRPQAEEEKHGVEYRALDDLLRESDFISLHVPLVAETRHLIGQREFNLMKSNAILINTARGPVIDENALVEALKTGKIAGAGLDVFEREPQIEPELLQLDNVTIAPHIGSASVATRARMATMTAENIIAVFDGETPPNLVNKEIAKK
ncbi:MAG TPA: D-glycerate dehydrogenase [Firmicutes bacterium]|jgi:glyoxylate reductase|nr:D-glycerate dehydrogenase [Bacillota bacterium]HAZ21624.1 D-glycerate dehydrogenase [Bacillota bacterium]HBE07221.1 D-glycerate dehydrogenase [Bacillota bacterium]HBG44227.1 D-glycerate dehydrogenase [Bacillota bacterium]HBR24492.1 D-glycerate dehydrogenase [Bacillota bacterium]